MPMRRLQTRAVKTLIAVATVSGLLLAAGCSGDSSDDSDSKKTQGQQIPAEATAIMETDPYTAARWSYLVVDPETDEVIYSNQADTFMFLASQTKHFTVGTVFNDLGVDRKVTTPVYATAAPAGGTLTGDLVLVGSGDLALGGRNADQAKFDFATDGIDHVYADALPGAVLAPGNPLAGLDAMAEQVAASGVTRVDGDVLVDPRLWETYDTVEGLVPSIFVNDNLVDIQAITGRARTAGHDPDAAGQRTVHHRQPGDHRRRRQRLQPESRCRRSQPDAAARHRLSPGGQDFADRLPHHRRVELGSPAVHRGTAAQRHHGGLDVEVEQ